MRLTADLWPLRFLKWTAGEWARRGLGVLFVATSAAQLGVAWVLSASVFRWLDEGRNWVGGGGLFCGVAAVFLACFGLSLCAGRRVDRMALACSAALSLPPVLLALWNLSVGGVQDGLLFSVDLSQTVERWIAVLLALPLLAMAGAGLYAIAHRRAITPATPPSVRRVLMISAAALVTVSSLGAHLAVPHFDDDRHPAADLAWFRSPAGKWSRALQNHAEVVYWAECALIPAGAPSGLTFGDATDCYAASSLLDHPGCADDEGHVGNVLAALVDPDHSAEDRRGVLELLPDHPEALLRAIPALQQLLAHGELSSLAVAEDYPVDAAEAKQLCTARRSELRRLAADALRQAFALEPAIITIAAPVRPAQQLPRAAPTHTAVPGVGVGGLIVGYATVDDVLKRYGRDCRVSRYSHLNQRFSVSYRYRDDDTWRREPNDPARPQELKFVDEILSEIVVGGSNTEIASLQGVGVGSPLEDVRRVFGDHFVLTRRGAIDIYHYPLYGIEFWVHTKTSKVGSFRVFVRRT